MILSLINNQDDWHALNSYYHIPAPRTDCSNQKYTYLSCSANMLIYSLKRIIGSKLSSGELCNLLSYYSQSSSNSSSLY